MIVRRKSEGAALGAIQWAYFWRFLRLGAHWPLYKLARSYLVQSEPPPTTLNKEAFELTFKVTPILCYLHKLLFLSALLSLSSLISIFYCCFSNCFPSQLLIQTHPL